MSKTEIPVVVDAVQEQHLRSTYRGKYRFKGKCPFTGKEINVIRSTRLEYPCPIPVEVPVYLKRPESTDDRIRRLMSE